MKLKDLLEFSAVGNNRPSPGANIHVSPPLPDELCKDRTYCENKKKKRSKDEINRDKKIRRIS
jgi:hypothetical protein